MRDVLLEERRHAAEQRGPAIAHGRARDEVEATLRDTGVVDDLSGKKVFSTVDEALRALHDLERRPTDRPSAPTRASLRRLDEPSAA